MKNIPYAGNILIGRQEEAVYIESEEPTQRHNVFIEALPKIWAYKEVVADIACYPIYSKADRKKSIEYRLNAVERLRSLVEPLPVFTDVERRISRMMRSGYVCRNPISKEYVKQLRAGFPRFDPKKPAPLVGPTHSASGFAMLGLTGMGKSHSIKRILPLYPQVIYHKKYYDNIFIRKQLVWMYMDCPGNGSPRGLMTSFFQLFDMIMGTEYYKRDCNRKTVDDLMPLLAYVSWFFGLGVLVIDEIQRLCNAKGTGKEEMLGFLVYLVNTVGVPIILIGTYQAIDLLSHEFAEARRAAGQGDMIWSNLRQDGKVWGLLMESIFRYQFTKIATPLSESLSDALYEESQGIVDIAIKLYMFAQWEIIGHGNEIITPQLISKVAKKYLNLAKPILDALRMGDYDKLKEIKDIKPAMASLDLLMEQSKQRVTITGTLATLRNIRKSQQNKPGNVDFLVPYVTKSLAEAGYDSRISEEIARKALDRHASDIDLKKVMLEAFLIASQYEKDRGKKTKDEIKGPSERHALPSGDLRALTHKKSDALDNYNAFKAEGNIQQADQFLNKAE